MDIQNLLSNASKNARGIEPIRGYIDFDEVDKIIASYERITPFLTLLFGALDYSPWVPEPANSGRASGGSRHLFNDDSTNSKCGSKK